MTKKTVVWALGLSLLGLLAVAQSTQARGKDDAPRPPECQVEDGGILVCK